MDFGGKITKFIRRFVGLSLLASTILLFQNCGDDLPQTAFEDDLDSTDCLSEPVDCGPRPEYLQVTLDMQDNKIHPATKTELLLTGRCNTGNYDTHQFRWEIIDPNADVLRDGRSIGTCKRGVYQFPINIGSPLTTGANYTIKIKIVGGITLEDSTIEYYENFGTNGTAQVDFSKQ